MAGARFSRAGIVAGGQMKTQVARREAAMKQVRELLLQKPRSAFDLSEVLHLPSSTIYGYLRSMEAFGEAAQSPGVDQRGRKLWVAVVDQVEVSADKVRAEHAKRALIVKAAQMGMQRHWMDVAFFGPAPQQ